MRPRRPSPVSNLFSWRIEQPDRRLACRRRQVHVPLRRAQVLVPGELLDRLRRSAAHRQARAEGMAEDVQPAERLGGRHRGRTSRTASAASTRPGCRCSSQVSPIPLGFSCMPRLASMSVRSSPTSPAPRPIPEAAIRDPGTRRNAPRSPSGSAVAAVVRPADDVVTSSQLDQPSGFIVARVKDGLPVQRSFDQVPCIVVL